MNSRVLATALGLSLLAGPVTAQGLPGNLYVGGVAGVQFFTDNEDGDVDIDFDTGFVIGGLVGYRFSNLRAEAELDYQETEANDFVDVEILRYTASLLYDVTTFNLAVTPYGAIGIGLASIDSDGGGNDETNFTWHGEVGASYDVTSQLAIVPAYRFEWIDDDGLESDDPVTSHALRLGVRYSF